ncbi:peptidoglycan editing factor PgeF [Alphaproteobacteria bacterium]|nr:peptidoglycan editing factor PgeF [Alphaproteobacteria bacterium]MDA8624708.1 peptidoglycan editing factor PgeF [Alphaproteobacteria bacterium]MDA8666734.1 peptidoglycan editing factor PgeF [Alphaproteobacteria bacterium]MDA8780179.1 peptidoglycan editing factor PgeF [Alphaproteobacteria bacterium]MDB2393478.1 peptidoglycan editing factor PgeF [Alphaproteobacteria bacterium]
MTKLSPLTHSALNEPHGFFTRQGGVSKGIYASLNVGLGSDDVRDNVLENRARIAQTLNSTALVSAHQTHSTVTAFIDAPQEGIQADALVTKTPGLAVGALAADCAPVLLADTENGIIGAAHSGWRGAFDGILASVAETMRAHGAAHITAVIGPSISKAAYEVGPEFIARFEADYAADLDLFAPSQKPAHHMFDLPQFVQRQLGRVDIEAHILAACTYADETRFFSYRRATHRQEADYGRQISAICLPA